MSYQTLNAACIVETLLRLEHRIGERFPGSSLAAVCRELIGMAETVQQRSVAIASPHYLLRTAVFLVIAAGLGGLLFVAFKMNVQVGAVEIFSVFQGVEAAMNQYLTWEVDLVAQVQRDGDARFNVMKV